MVIASAEKSKRRDQGPVFEDFRVRRDVADFAACPLNRLAHGRRVQRGIPAANQVLIFKQSAYQLGKTGKKTFKSLQVRSLWQSHNERLRRNPCPTVGFSDRRVGKADRHHLRHLRSVLLGSIRRRKERGDTICLTEPHPRVTILPVPAAGLLSQETDAFSVCVREFSWEAYDF